MSMPGLEPSIPFPKPRPGWRLSPAQHRTLAAELRRKNPSSRAAQLRVLAARMKTTALLREWLIAIAEEA